MMFYIRIRLLGPTSLYSIVAQLLGIHMCGHVTTGRDIARARTSLGVDGLGPSR